MTGEGAHLGRRDQLSHLVVAHRPQEVHVIDDGRGTRLSDEAVIEILRGAEAGDKRAPPARDPAQLLLEQLPLEQPQREPRAP